MEKVGLIFIFFVSFTSFGQVLHNRHDRLTKDEFNQLREHRNSFVPADVRNDTVIVVRYSSERLSKMMNMARNISFAKNGTDTAGLKDESWLTEKQLERHKKMLRKFSKQYPERLKKELKKKGVNSIIVQDDVLQAQDIFKNKYWLKTIYINTQKSLADYGWVLSYTNLFHDPRFNKDYEIFFPMNHDLLELVE